MSEKQTPKREQVLEMLKEGRFTREQIAEKLEMSVASVSSQLTYLRWMGNFIIYDDDKIMSLTTEDGYKAWAAQREATKKTKAKTSTKTPEEQAEALMKTLSTQEKQLDNWKAKVAKIEADLRDMPDDLELAEMLAEAKANVTLLEIKAKRNNAKLEELDVDVEEEEELEEGEEEELSDEGLL